MRGQLVGWWESVDKVSVAIIFAIAAFSFVVVTTASPAIASRIGVPQFYFIKRHSIYLLLAIGIVVATSLLSVTDVKRFALLGCLLSLVALVLVIFSGTETKGAKRWLNVFGFSLQPSEFAKIFFTVLTAWLLSLKKKEPDFPAFKASLWSYLIFISLMMLQPDFGMVILVSAVWMGQLFIAGLPFIWFIGFGTFSFLAAIGAYITFPHIKYRVDSFIKPESFENYQVKKSLEAFKHGGMLGVGPGEGTVKQNIPDSHADFIFAVIGEEMGFIVCVVLITAFAMLIIRGLKSASQSTNQFTMFAVSGILLQIGLQFMFNVGMALRMFPTKGVTLPFISYGGSSMLSTAIAFGMMLAFTRKKHALLNIQTRNYSVGH